jgi:hypothetical protein
MFLHASCSRRNARKPPPPQGKRGPRGRAAGPARQLAASPSRPTVTPPSHPARHCRVGRVVSSVGRPAQRGVWRLAPPSGPDLAQPSGPDLYPQGGKGRTLPKSQSRRALATTRSQSLVVTRPGAALDPGCFDSDPIHQRFYSETIPVSPEPLYASYGPRSEEPRHRPSTDAAARPGETSESPNMGRAHISIKLRCSMLIFFRSPEIFTERLKGDGGYHHHPKVYPIHGVFLLPNSVTSAIFRRCHGAL